MKPVCHSQYRNSTMGNRGSDFRFSAGTRDSSTFTREIGSGPTVPRAQPPSVCSDRFKMHEAILSLP